MSETPLTPVPEQKKQTTESVYDGDELIRQGAVEFLHQSRESIGGAQFDLERDDTINPRIWETKPGATAETLAPALSHEQNLLRGLEAIDDQAVRAYFEQTTHAVAVGLRSRYGLTA